MAGRTIALYGDSGSGKTTQIGELAKHFYKTERKKTILNTADLGGHESLLPLVKLGVIIPRVFRPEDDPWIWTADLSEGSYITDEIGLIAGDSATSIADALLIAAAKSPTKIGQQNTQRFTVSSKGRNLSVGLNNEAHYGLIQTFLLDHIWKSSWLAERGVDVLWTFGTHRGENTDAEPIVGPKLAGKALTPQIPRWFKYTFRLVAVPGAPGEKPTHTLYLQQQQAGTGSISSSNSRYPLDAQSELPASLTPASLVEALRLIEQGQTEAYDSLKAELGL